MALDFVGGCIGGCAGVIVGHPLDTVKVHMQTQSSTSTKDLIRQIVAREGPKGLLKGVTSPLAGVAGLNAIVFTIYGQTQRTFNDPNSLWTHFVAGSCAGFFQSFLASPIELAKLRAQVSPTNTSPLLCARNLIEQQGVKGIYKGMGMQICRDVPSFAAYFVSYEYLVRLNCKRGHDVPTGSMLMAGGIAGVISWTITYPIDVVKSRLQCDGVNGPGKYLNAADCLRKSLANEGYSFLFRGLRPTILRAFPVNAAVFTVFTWTMRLLDQEFPFNICVIQRAEAVV